MEIRGYYTHLALMREGALDFTIQSPLFSLSTDTIIKTLRYQACFQAGTNGGEKW
jgi:hypothetical protein